MDWVEARFVKTNLRIKFKFLIIDYILKKIIRKSLKCKNINLIIWRICIGWFQNIWLQTFVTNCVTKIFLITNFWILESSNNHGRPVIIDFQFGRLQNVSAVRFYVACNGNTLHIRSFRRVRISFSTAIAIPEVGGNNVGDTENNATYSPRTVDVDVGRREFSNDCSGSGELSAKWIRLPVWPSRIAQHLRVELFHGGAEWMMISEVDFETGRFLCQKFY